MTIEPKTRAGFLRLVVAPVLLAGIEFFIPRIHAQSGMSEFSLNRRRAIRIQRDHVFGPQWWFAAHGAEPLVVVVAFGLLSLTDTFGRDANASIYPSPGCRAWRRSCS